MESFVMQSLVITANIISLVYNIPQIIHTINTKKADDISGIFLWMRLLSGILWIIYCIYVYNLDVLISWTITTCSSIILLYYKYIYYNCIFSKEPQLNINDFELPNHLKLKIFQ